MKISATLQEPPTQPIPYTGARLQYIIELTDITQALTRSQISLALPVFQHSNRLSLSTAPQPFLHTRPHHPTSSFDLPAVLSLLGTRVDSGERKPSRFAYPRLYKQRFSRLPIHPKIPTWAGSMVKRNQTSEEYTWINSQGASGKAARKRTGTPLYCNNSSLQP